MSALVRSSTRRPGYDCIREPCGQGSCGTSPGGNHGIHNEEWVYAVSNGVTALTVKVNTGIYPATVPRDRLFTQIGRTGPEAVCLAVHSSRRISSDDAKSSGHECEYVDSKRCFGDHTTWFSGANEEYLEMCPGAKFEQPEGFWLALERAWVLRAWPIELEPEWHVCPTCSGEGAEMIRIGNAVQSRRSATAGAVELPRVLRHIKEQPE